jgi:hypothetical protein
MANRETLIEAQIKYQKHWRRDFKCLIYFHYLMGFAIILLSSLLATKPEIFGFSQPFYQLIAGLIAAATAINTFLQPNAMALRFHRAWVILSTEITLYLSEPSRPLAAVIDAWSQGEAIIHNLQRDRRRKNENTRS